MSAATIAKKWVIKTAFNGRPKREDLEIVEEQLPPLKDGGGRGVQVVGKAILKCFGHGELNKRIHQTLATEWKGLATLFYNSPGMTVLSGQVGKVIETKNASYTIGDLVFGNFGWVSHSICNGNPEGHLHGLRKVNPTSSFSPSTALGILGMPGATAYFGLLEVCNPKPGETLLVNAAAGAVGSAVGQIGKIKGMRVVGFAGSDEKVEYLKSIGFDAAYNYKTVSSLSEAIAEGCPNGVDVFFDNVGGEFFETVIDKMNSEGRISCCGSISQYNLTEPSNMKAFTTMVVLKQLKIQGFFVTKWLSQWGGAFDEMTGWITENKLQYRERVFEGFENIFEGFSALFQGSNIGKVVIKV